MILSDVSSSWLGSIGQFVSVLTIFVLVLLITLLVTRWIAGYQQSQMHNQNLKVVETLKLTVNSYIQIIEVGDVCLVIAVSKDRIEKLAEIDKGQLKFEPTDFSAGKVNFGESFHDIFDKVKQHLPKK